MMGMDGEGGGDDGNGWGGGEDDGDGGEGRRDGWRWMEEKEGMVEMSEEGEKDDRDEWRRRRRG